MKDSGTKYWIIDKVTLEKLQVLKQFVDFVAGLEYTAEEHKNNANTVKYLIENLGNPETFIKEWMVAIHLIDIELQAKINKKGGLYWKKWWVTFEFGRLEIESESEFIDKNEELYEETHYYGFVDFNKEIHWKRMLLEKDLKIFIEDAMNFKSYITETLDVIESEIYI